LLPLALNYLASDVFQRVERARAASFESGTRPSGKDGLWSELGFRLRRPLGVLSGAIDKLLISKTSSDSYEVEIIDFKTNRISQTGSQSTPVTQAPAPAHGNVIAGKKNQNQFAFNFDVKAAPVIEGIGSLGNAVQSVANDYKLQMQSYALAIRELVPSLKISKLRVTLHFLEPNVEYQIADELLETSACESSIDAAMHNIISSTKPAEFPVKPATHCRMCNFLKVCEPGREFVRR